MRTVIIDSSCFFDLKKGRLIEAIFDLSYHFSIPESSYENELISFSDKEKEHFVRDLGLKIIELSGNDIKLASEILKKHVALGIYDCFTLASAKRVSDPILLTGDRALRNIATQEMGVEVHGVLWLIDQLDDQRVVDRLTLLEALRVFRKDKMVFLPEKEIEKRIRRFRRSNYI